MTTAIISDIHGNAEALKTVLADIESRGIERVICLGDIIGYGPDPLECVDLVRQRCEWSLMGNHDFGVLYEPTNFNQAAQSAAYWTREQFDAEPDQELREARYEFLGRLRVRVVEEPPAPADGETGAPDGYQLLFVHGSPRRPINEYIFPDDIVSGPEKLGDIFDRVQTLAACGHTHVPGVFTEEPDFYPPTELTDGVYEFEPPEDGKPTKAIINVGSVGQPRDHDPRAAYAILHPGKVEFIRLEYDAEATAKKIYAIKDLSDWLGERLLGGR